MAYRPPMAYRPSTTQQRNCNRSDSGLQLAKPASVARPPTVPDMANELVFPGLGGTVEVGELQKLNFASAAGKEKEATICLEASEDDAVLPGWVCMRSRDRKIIDKRNVRPPASEELDPELVNRAVGEMVARWQGERDSLNSLLGDRSPYWNVPPIGEEEEDEGL